jgi:DNA-binding PadR family transcriptional regulator
MLKQILLGFLSYHSMSGYDLKSAIDLSTAHFWHAHHSQIYTILRQMEQNGLVTSQLIEGESQPDRRVYSLTPAGEKELQTWLDRPMTELPTMKEAFMVRMFFSGKRDKASVLNELRFQRELHVQRLGFFKMMMDQGLQNAARRYPNTESDVPFWKATLRLGEMYDEVYIAWINETIAGLEKE